MDNAHYLTVPNHRDIAVYDQAEFIEVDHHRVPKDRRIVHKARKKPGRQGNGDIDLPSRRQRLRTGKKRLMKAAMVKSKEEKLFVCVQCVSDRFDGLLELRGRAWSCMPRSRKR